MKAAQQALRDAERRFPVRVRIAVRTESLGSRLDQILAWVDAKLRCGRRSSQSMRGRCEMFLRMLCTAVVLLFAILAFCGFGPMPSVWGRVSFGLGFLLIAFLVWRSWRFIVGDFSPPIMDAFTRRHVDPGRRETSADER
jgi:hypothetical protein